MRTLHLHPIIMFRLVGTGYDYPVELFRRKTFMAKNSIADLANLLFEFQYTTTATQIQ